MLREVGDDEADQVIAFTQECVVTTLDTRIAQENLQFQNDLLESVCQMRAGTAARTKVLIWHGEV